MFMLLHHISEYISYENQLVVILKHFALLSFGSAYKLEKSKPCLTVCKL